MAGKLERLKLGLDILRLYILLVPLQIAGFVLVLVGIVTLGNLDNSGPLAPATFAGTVTRKVEHPVPNRNIVAYAVEITPDGNSGDTVTRWIEKRKWDTLSAGDHWEDPKPSGGLTAPWADLGTAIKEILVGVLLIYFAILTRKAIAKKREAMNGETEASAGSAEFKKLARALSERAEKMKAAGKSSYQAPGKPSSPKAAAAKPVIRQNTITRAGWF